MVQTFFKMSILILVFHFSVINSYSQLKVLNNDLIEVNISYSNDTIYLEVINKSHDIIMYTSLLCLFTYPVSKFEDREVNGMSIDHLCHNTNEPIELTGYGYNKGFLRKISVAKVLAPFKTIDLFKASELNYIVYELQYAIKKINKETDIKHTITNIEMNDEEARILEYCYEF